ncbi:MAG TPA: hypothetical protein VKQ72_20145, partial [Aggregatilineales bacterium]|nr:hypothetical protein [Aggregatilineales bacterium]
MARNRTIIIAILLLLVAFSRIPRLDEFDFHQDEVWTVYQTFGSPAQIVQWVPFDWAPLHFLFVGSWRSAVGIDPIPLRYSSALMSLLTATLLYRVARRLFGKTGVEAAGQLTILAYAAIGYATYQSVIIR